MQTPWSSLVVVVRTAVRQRAPGLSGGRARLARESEQDRVAGRSGSRARRLRAGRSGRCSWSLAPEHRLGPARRALGSAERVGPAHGALAAAVGAEACQGVRATQRPLGAPQAGLVQVLVARQGVAAAEGGAVVLDPVGHTGATTRAAHTESTRAGKERQSG